jgi:hypothetical protein
MSIVIRKVEGDRFVNFEVIAGDKWELREQVEAFEDWLQNNSHKLDPQFRWVADIGFQPRKGAMGGGPPLTLNLMKHCFNANLKIYLSEYPRTRTLSERGYQLRDELRTEISSGSSAMDSAEKLLLAEAFDNLDTFDDEPEHEIYIQAKLLIKLLKSLQNHEAKRLFILYCLYDIPDSNDNLPIKRLIDALQPNEIIRGNQDKE